MRCFHQTGFWKDKICVILINVVLCVQVVGTLLTSNNEKGACHHVICRYITLLTHTHYITLCHHLYNANNTHYIATMGQGQWLTINPIRHHHVFAYTRVCMRIHVLIFV